MARRNDVLGVTGAETMIGAGVVIEGNLTSESDIVIDGIMTGDVKAIGDVTIGVNAEVKGHVKGLNVSVAGSLTGNILSEGETTIRETGHVSGDITTANLTIVSGGVFNGRSTINQQRELDLPIDGEA
jgi:cytoskeletal protein CcmA (bactofilin family)